MEESCGTEKTRLHPLLAEARDEVPYLEDEQRGSTPAEVIAGETLTSGEALRTSGTEIPTASLEAKRK